MLRGSFIPRGIICFRIEFEVVRNAQKLPHVFIRRKVEKSVNGRRFKMERKTGRASLTE